MKTYEIKKFSTFQITGRGTVLTIHKDDHAFVHDISKGDVLFTPEGKRYEVSSIEMFTNMAGIGKNVGVLVTELLDDVLNLRMGTSCGSCIHTNRPKKPREHAAHYEVAKTERWCFKHQCHVTRETTCDDYEGVNRAAKTAFTRIKNYNQRALEVRDVVKHMPEGEVEVDDYKYRVSGDWIAYCYKSKYGSNEQWYNLRSKEKSTERQLERIREQLKI